MSLYTKLKALFVLLFIFSLLNNIHANECLSKQKIKIGLIEDEYIDYKYYLYYSLGEFASKNETEFEFSVVNNNVDEFDIIFGEFRDLKKLSSNKIKVPDKITNYYQINNIEVSDNLFPLDLDTYILLSKVKTQRLNFEEFSRLYNPIKYTLGMSFKTKEDIINLLIYSLENRSIEFNSLSFELTMNLFKETYKNLNKNILNTNYLEVYNSYENSENIYTLFSDGILLYKNLIFENYQLFPKSKYVWDIESGKFIDKQNYKPISFFGFSAYLNNTQSSSFLCYLIDEEVRLKAFREFNIQFSPLSVNEIKTLENEVPESYKEILLKKNKNIFNPNYPMEYKNFNLFYELMFNKKKYEDIFEYPDYLNR